VTEAPGIAILGQGFMGRAHAEALRALRSPRLVALAGRDAGRLEEMRERYGFARVTTDWRELLADDVDVVLNLGPNALHAEPTIAAAEAGKHVLCEKPLARSADEARSMLAAVGDVVAMCGFNYRFVPAVQRAKRLVEAGEIGDVLHFRGTYRQSWGSSTEDVWRFDAAQAGGGALGDLASHVIDLARYLVGDLDSIAAQAATFVPGREVDDAVAAAVRFAGGAIGTIEATRFATGEANRFTWEINGTRGSLAFDVERPGELIHDGRRVFCDDRWPPGHVLGWGDSFFFELRHFLAAVAGRGTVGPHGATFADGVAAAEACDAILRSAETGQRITLKGTP
jgi:predicted dehydrogenase